MYHPTSRVLTVLELLQSKPSISGRELADVLEVDIRTVRRYILILQDIGIPVEGNVGRAGGYRLRPGFKLPPLLFSEEEATALMLGLLGTAWLEIDQPSSAVQGAMAKILRVLPLRAKDRLKAITSNIFFYSGHQGTQPDVALLLTLSEAVAQQQRLDLSYRALPDRLTRRTVEPYGIVGLDGHWYLVGYCCLRQDFRKFRLDRMESVRVINETFDKAIGFDCRAYMLEREPQNTLYWSVEVEFKANLYTMQQIIPASYGTLTSTPSGTLFNGLTENLDFMARYLISLSPDFVVKNPPELEQALLDLATRITHSFAR